MKIVDLFEGLSPILFHSTHLNNFMKMLQTDKIRLSPTFTKGMESNHKHSYYLSTSRTRTGSYHLGDSRYSVLIEFDGRKLASKFTGEPMDYWGEDFRKAKGGEYEQEDRLFSNEPYIDNFLRYVNRVDILLGNRPDMPQLNKSLRQALIHLKRNGIPVRVYESNRDWITGSNNFVTVDQILSLETSDVNPFNRNEDEDEAFLRRHRAKRENSRSSTDGLRVIYKALMIDDYSLFSPEEKARLDRYISGIDYRSTVSAELHNASNDQSLRPVLEKIGRIMRRNGLRTPSDLADFIHDKWN